MSTLSCVCIGDPHFKLNNQCTFKRYKKTIDKAINDTDPDIIVVMGDILHKHEQLHTMLLNQAVEWLHHLSSKAPVYAIVGNHDYINNTQFLSSNHWMNVLKPIPNITVIDKGYVLTAGENRLTFCPYVFPGRFKEALDTFDPEWNTSTAILCHQEFKGCQMGAIVSILGDEWNKHLPIILSGHIHKRQQVDTNIFYVGSSMQHAYGENPDKTILYCKWNHGEQVEFTHIPLDLPVKKTLYKNVEETFNYKPPDFIDGSIRLTVKDTIANTKMFQKSTKYKHLARLGIHIKIDAIQDVEDHETDYDEGQGFEFIFKDLLKGKNYHKLIDEVHTRMIE